AAEHPAARVGPEGDGDGEGAVDGFARGVLHLHRDGRADDRPGRAAGRLLHEGDPGGRGLTDGEVGVAVAGARPVPDADLSGGPGVSRTVGVRRDLRHDYAEGGIGAGDPVAAAGLGAVPGDLLRREFEGVASNASDDPLAIDRRLTGHAADRYDVAVS